MVTNNATRSERTQAFWRDSSPAGRQVTFGERLTKARERAGYDDLRALARAIKKCDSDAPGADHTSIGKYERGESKPKPQWLAAFCRVTSTNANWLLLEEGTILRAPPSKYEEFYRRVAEGLEDLEG